MRALRLLAVLGLAGAALVAGPVPGAGAEQTGPVVAGQDAYVISTAVRTTYDTTELRVRNTPAQKLQAYLTFDLRGVPAGATGLRATLRLTASPASQSGRVEVRTSGAFNERTVTWAGRPAASAVQGSAAVARGATVLVDAGPVGGPGVRSYALTAPAGQGAQLRFAASEDPDPARRPALTVSWTPPAPAVSDRLVPREGAWWGSYPGQAPGDVEAREAVYGRRVDILHRYHDWDEVWPTPEEQAYAAGGRILFEGWENRVFGGTTSCWADIAAGASDAAIDAQAQRLAAFGDRLFVGFMHEPEDNAGPCQPGAVDDATADMGSSRTSGPPSATWSSGSGRSPPTSSGCSRSWATTRPPRGPSPRATTWSTGSPGTPTTGPTAPAGPATAGVASSRSPRACTPTWTPSATPSRGCWASTAPTTTPPWGTRPGGYATSRRPCAPPCPRSRRWCTSTGSPPRSPATPAPGWPTARPGPGPGSRPRCQIPG